MSPPLGVGLSLAGVHPALGVGFLVAFRGLARTVHGLVGRLDPLRIGLVLRRGIARLALGVCSTCRPSRLARSGFLVVLAAQAFGDVLRVLGDVTLLLGDLLESLLGFSVLARAISLRVLTSLMALIASSISLICLRMRSVSSSVSRMARISWSAAISFASLPRAC